MENWKVYMHKSPSGKVYIGVTKRNLEIRWANGEGYKKQPHFYSAIKKYGWDNFEHLIIQEYLTREEASKM